MKEITQSKMKDLLRRRILKFTKDGLTNKKGDIVGFVRTKHKRFIEDKYANWVFYKKKPQRKTGGSKR